MASHDLSLKIKQKFTHNEKTCLHADISTGGKADLPEQSSEHKSIGMFEKLVQQLQGLHLLEVSILLQQL